MNEWLTPDMLPRYVTLKDKKIDIIEAEIILKLDKPVKYAFKKGEWTREELKSIEDNWKGIKSKIIIHSPTLPSYEKFKFKIGDHEFIGYCTDDKQEYNIWIQYPYRDGMGYFYRPVSIRGA